MVVGTLSATISIAFCIFLATHIFGLTHSPPTPLSHVLSAGLRSNTSLVVDTSTCYTTHQAAMLIGYGAHAICPYLGYESARQWRLTSRTESLIKVSAASQPARNHEGGYVYERQLGAWLLLPLVYARTKELG